MMRISSRAVILLSAGLLACEQTEQYEPKPIVVAIIDRDTIDVEAYDEMATTASRLFPSRPRSRQSRHETSTTGCDDRQTVVGAGGTTQEAGRSA